MTDFIQHENKKEKWNAIISKYYLTKQLEAKGWTGTAFTKFLGNHQKKMTPAPTKIFGAECMKKYFGSFYNHLYSLWDKEVVDKIEKTPEFQTWLEKSLARRAKICKKKCDIS